MSLTPMMQQYVKTKEEYKDCILFYRLGDFYEMFFEDALTASKELEITLTGKDCGLEERAPMCGVPYHAVDGYLNKLVSRGYKVAICEQVEDPKLAKGLVKREVVRIVTPGTNLDTQALDETKNNYLMCISCVSDRFGVSTADITTGEYLVTELESPQKLQDEIVRYAPSEIICSQSLLVSAWNWRNSEAVWELPFFLWTTGILTTPSAAGRFWSISTYPAWKGWACRITTAASSPRARCFSISGKPRRRGSEI